MHEAPASSSRVLEAELTLHPALPGPTIHRNIYGHFSEHLGRGIYEGIWVGDPSTVANTRGIRDDVVEALKRIRVPVLRWPGGCFADEYHWRHGVGPRSGRPRTINTHWGGVIESNYFGTHEFMDLCERLGADPYVCGNVGSGSVAEMRDWVEYMTSDSESAMADLRRSNGRSQPWQIPYFGVGNESWGCGGNMRAEYYADTYRRYATFVKSYSGNRVQRIACGANGADYEWTRVLMERAAAHMDGLSLHWYTLPTGNWATKGSAVDFGEAEWHSTLHQALQIEELLTGHSAIMDRFDPQRRVALVVDEWGTWYDVEPGTNPGFLSQENTLRDALVAAVTLNAFNRHCERVRMANLAQTVNVLQAVLRTAEARLLLTPTYHVFEMYTVHHDATHVPVELTGPSYRSSDGAVALPMLDASASRDASGRTHVSIVNLDPVRAARIAVRSLSGRVHGRILTAGAMNARNTFTVPDAVAPIPYSAQAASDASHSVTVPPKSVLVFAAE